MRRIQPAAGPFESSSEARERPIYSFGIVARRVHPKFEVLRISWAPVGGECEAAYDEVSNLFGVEAGQQIVEVAAAPQGFHEGPSSQR